jgi:hypothetical protein
MNTTEKVSLLKDFPVFAKKAYGGEEIYTNQLLEAESFLRSF